jgi:hypothetical protein
MAWKQDAIEFGQHVKAGEWRLGLLVARNVLQDKGRGNRNDAAASNQGKVSGREFAKTAGVSQDTVRRYFNAWQEAAKAEIVPDASELEPEEELEGLDVESLPSWSTYYRKVRTDARVSDREVVDRIREKPELLKDVIKANPKVAQSVYAEAENERIEAKAKALGVDRSQLSDGSDEVADAIDEAFEPIIETLTRQETIEEYLRLAGLIQEAGNAIEAYGVIGVVKEQKMVEEANSKLSNAIWSTESVLKKNIENRK